MSGGAPEVAHVPAGRSRRPAVAGHCEGVDEVPYSKCGAEIGPCEIVPRLVAQHSPEGPWAPK
eukprot:7312112-Pyramimonas_sp.AAC.1